MTPDAGFTLTELLVAMSILVVVLGIFTDAFLNVQRGVRKTTSLATSQLQARNAFQLLDRTARYANAVNDPATVNGSQYVEYEIGDVSATTSVVQTCYQWRATSAGQLQWRNFTISSPSAAAGSQTPTSPAWRTVVPALDLTQGPVFATDGAGGAIISALEPGNAAPSERQLAVTLHVLGGSNPGGRASVQSLFAAANTTTATVPGQKDTSVVPATVCQQAGRP